MTNQKSALIGKTQSRSIILWGLLLTVFLAALFVVNSSLLHKFDDINYDFLLRNFPDNRVTGQIVIVDLDENSLFKYGQWPWPRHRVADLLKKIAAAQPAVVALDMVFAEPDRTSVKRMLEDMAADRNIKTLLERIPPALKDNDRLMAEALSSGPFILGNKFQFGETEENPGSCILHPLPISLLDGAPDPKTDLPESRGVLCNLKILAEKVHASGFINFSPDEDGMIRRLPLLMDYNGKTYATLSLAAVLQFKKTDTVLLRKTDRTAQTLHFPQTSVPVDRHGQMLIKFRGPQKSFKYISAADILTNSVPAKVLRNKIVFVGTSAAGLHDLLTTPFDPTFPGVEVHATVADNLLAGDFLSMPGWSQSLVLGIIIVLGVLLTFLIARGRTLFCFMIMLFSAAALWFATRQIFYGTGLFIAAAFPITAVVFLYLVLTVYKFRMEERKILSNLRELILTQDVTIESMASLAEYRDKETGGHIQRTRMYVKVLAEHLKNHRRYKHFLSNENIDLLYKSAPLHDIGKVGIPDKILRKPAPLEGEELEIMKTHATIGYKVIEASIRKLGKKSFLFIAGEIAYCHHEKWDGTGYPRGLRGEEIPISARLMALADVYDALISQRVYKYPIAHAIAVETIKQGRGTHFDPDVVDAFVEIHQQFQDIAEKFADTPQGKNLALERYFSES